MTSIEKINIMNKGINICFGHAVVNLTSGQVYVCKCECEEVRMRNTMQGG